MRAFGAISSRTPNGMLIKPSRSAAILSLPFVIAVLGSVVRAQAPAPAGPVGFVAPATLNRLFNEAEKAFEEKNYGTAVTKLEELIKLLGTKKDAPFEMLYFNIGLAHLLGGKNPDAEAAFTDCLKRFPKGEYASRCYLGVGRAAMLQDSPQKKERAIESLRIAAKDPKYRSEAGLWLGQTLDNLGKRDEALKVFRSLMGSNVRTPQQTTAAVEVVGLLADLGKLEDLSFYLDSLGHQPGVKDSIAWFANQIVVRGDELVQAQSYDAALAIYRSVPPRSQILETQAGALEEMRKDVKALETRVKAEEKMEMNQRTGASQLLNLLKPAVEQSETAKKAIDEKPDLDAALLMRRGRCCYYLKRYEEALVCFRTIRTKFPQATDAQSAAYAEIVILNTLKNTSAIKERCDEYLRKFPDADNSEEVATLAGEVLVQGGNWKEVGSFYRGLESRFPKSESLDRFVFFQGLAFFMEGNFKESTPLLTRFIKNYPNSQLNESAHYYVAMSHFLSNSYKETLAACAEYLKKFPDGQFAGDMRYRLSFIDFNDKDVDQDDKIIRDLSGFLAQHPKDKANGSMYCLLADTYKRKKTKTDQEAEATEDKAIESYIKAVWTDSPDDVLQYALESATNLLQARKDWNAIADLHAAFLKEKPESQLALISVSWVARMKSRLGKPEEASEILANALNAKIGNPASEQVEYLIDELVKTIVPRKKPKDLDAEALDKQLQEVLNKAISGRENKTTAARIYYARARLAEMLRRRDLADLYLKGIATANAEDPQYLSPALLSVCGDILLKTGDLAGAEAMFKRLAERYVESMFSDAGPVGLGYVALARKNPEEALKIYDNALANIAGMSRFKECTLGKLQALFELEKYEPAIKLAAEISADKKTFGAEITAKAQLILGNIYRKQAAKSAAISPAVAKEQYAMAHGVFIRSFLAYKSFPELSAEAIWQASEVAAEMGDEELSRKNIQDLLAEQKLKETKRYKDALEK
jgi:TolA-binding protein